MTHTKRAWGASLVFALATGASTAALAQAAQPVDPREARIEQLESEVATLASEVQDLKRTQAQQIQTLAPAPAAKAGPPAAIATINGGHPAIASADGKFTANFHGILQFDAAEYNQDSPGPLTRDFRRSGPALAASPTNVDLTHARDLKNGDDFRRARIGVDGVAFGDWDYRLIFDFAGSGVENTGQLYEAWVQYSGFKPFHERIGAFPPSIGLEDAGTTNGMPLLERSAIEDMARGLAAGDTRTAASIWGNGDHWFVSAAVTGRVIGVLNTGTAAAVPQTYGDQLGFVGRVAGTPFHGSDWLIHLGVHGSYVDRPANTGGPGTGGPSAANAYVIALSNTPELRVDGTKLINTGNIDAAHASTVGLEFAAQKGSLYVESEYEWFDVDRTDPGLASPNFHGWYIEGSWVITGERRVYNKQTAAFDAPPVAHPFSWNGGGWGAWELAARYSDADLNYAEGAAGHAPLADSVRGGDEQNWTIGLNWYPNSFVRFMLDYQNVRIDRLSPCGGPNSFTSASCSSVWMTPVGAQIGQSFSAVALRSQFAF